MLLKKRFMLFPNLTSIKKSQALIPGLAGADKMVLQQKRMNRLRDESLIGFMLLSNLRELLPDQKQR